MKVVCVVGARPNFMKIAPILRAFREHAPQVQAKLVHTGQHYDYAMNEAFFEQLGIPAPDISLEVGSGSHARQTAEIMTRFEEVLDTEQPDCVLVVGDVNSTIACALVAAKKGVKIVHVEAGLRSRDRSMPEEINRILTDQLSDRLYTTEADALDNLRAEGIDADKVVFAGNVMIDTLLASRARAVPARTTIEAAAPCGSGFSRDAARTAGPSIGTEVPPTALAQSIADPRGSGFSRDAVHSVEPPTPRHPGERLDPVPSVTSEATAPKDPATFLQSPTGYAVLTLHRPSNVDDPATLKRLLDTLTGISRDLPIVFPIHPRTRQKIQSAGLGNFFDNPQILALPPIGYFEMLGMMSDATVVLTDSGGMQEETTALGVPCVTLRENTERPITLTQGTNTLVGTDPQAIRAGVTQALSGNGKSGRRPETWDGHAAERIVTDLVAWLLG
ncbi:MAG: UDP-N-acetyl glucosamine 2-epimerase [Dokdonella sp.]|nr:UDP-N-acetyl glucosamine 2-epimerase [Dokdonella sp.]